MHTYFLGLGLVGYDCLWGRMIRSGVAGAVGQVKQMSVFPNGDVLRTTFTGLSTVDQFLIPAVIFYNQILGNGSPADGMLLVSLFTTMQTMSHCMMVLGWNRGKRSWWGSFEHLFWVVFNQAWGAAAVYPLYCFTHVQRLLTDESMNEDCGVGPSDSTEALALVPTALIGSITPAMLLYPAFNPSCATSRRQGLIAFYRFTPLALAVAHPLFSWAIQKLAKKSSKKNDLNKSKVFVTASLIISGTSALVGHGWALLGSAEAGWRRVFWPEKSIVAASTTAIADGAREFLQLDIFVITAALVPFADLALRSSAVVRRLQKRYRWASLLMDSFIIRNGILILASAVLSPGAVLAFSLAAKAYF